MILMIRNLAVLAAICLTLEARADEPVDFNRNIRPILSENCFACHGLDEESREADLRLDHFEAAIEAEAIVPGHPEDSSIIARVRSDDEIEIMPPPETEKRLSQRQIDLLERWISEGGEYQPHWSWKPLRRPQVPKVTTQPASNSSRDGSTDRTLAAAAAVDAFLHAEWTKQEATPVGLASPRDRVRRLSFDLRGVPPTMEEVREFESSPTDEAFFALRDRWMKELAYAEHQAVRWLDLVRWADTSGFVSDEPIASGAYRAWIIHAIDQNMPFDQFSIEQLAGDLLPNPTSSQLVASGYNRIVNTNCEAGAIEEEQLYKLKGEHVRALSTVWLGLTTECAECHDHKFDPISAKDYYSLAAFFDDLVEAGVYTPGDRREPLHYVHHSEMDQQRDTQLSAEVERIRNELRDHANDKFSEWESMVREQLADKDQRKDFVWIPGLLPAARIIEGEFDLIPLPGGGTARETVMPQGKLHRHHAAELMTGYLSHGSLKTEEAKDAFYVDVWIDENDRPEMLGFQVSHGKYGRLGWRTDNYETYFWGEDGSGQLSKPQPWSDPKRVKRIDDLPKESGWVRLRVPFKDLVRSAPGQSFEATGMAWLQSGGHVRWGDSGLELRFDKATERELVEPAIRRWWETPMNRQIYERRDRAVAGAVRKAAKDRDALQTDVVLEAYQQGTQPELLAQLRKHESELFVLRAKSLPVLVSKATNTPKTTRLLSRGDYQDTTGPIVTAAVPAFLSDGNPTHKTRLDLAHWLFHEKNPLTSRVFVNRLWHQFFGRGLSETLEDAGTQGDWPSHVSLLDWLACEFRASGWDRDYMVRILTSARAYQLDSKPSNDLQQRDPGNRWHARQSRFRLPAESVRDSSLHAAGLLQKTLQVPRESFYPYQPSPYWTRSDKIMYGSRHMIWATSEEQAQYKRSLYTFWKRQNIHPTMLAFDAPTRQECTAQRNITNTPGQALALLNDPIFVEAARVLAMNLCRPKGLSDLERIDLAFRQTLQRSVRANELKVLLKLLAEQREHYLGHPEEAKALVSIGQTPLNGGDLVEIAAWTAVARTTLNLHEFLNRP